MNLPVFAISLVLSACASGPRFSGHTIASAQLRADTSVFVIGIAKAKTGCDHVDSIDTEILSVPNDIQGNKAGIIVGGGDTKERWVATACGKTSSTIVTFTPDGKGGSYMAVQPEK